MQKITFLKLLFIFVFTTSTINAQTTVTTNAALSTAISNATAGTTIILKNGTWNNVYMNIINKTGTAANPITIKAETAGSVFLEGNSRIAMGGQYIKIEGLVFRNPASLTTSGTTTVIIEPVIKFRDGSSNICTNCSIKNIKIDTYNGTAAQSDKLVADGGTGLTFKWVLLYGQYNEISYCTFKGKKGIGSVINDNRDTSIENYTKIHHNYFTDRTFVGTYVDENNDQDAIRIGNSATSQTNSFTEVYDNLFNNWFGEIEIISNKSCNNKYYNNTFRNYSGSLTLRHGNSCEVFGNYFFAGGNQFSGGIRLTDENHKIYNNYIENVSSTKSTAAGGGTSSNLGGINILGGLASSPLNGYYQVKNATIVHNTFVNCDYGIRIGGGSNTLPPLDLVVANNIFLNNTNPINQIVAAQSSPSNPYVYTKNIRKPGTWSLVGTLNGNVSTTSGILLTLPSGSTGTEFYRLLTNSIALNVAIGDYSSFLTTDILGSTRPTTNIDAGAEEFGAAGTKLPYTTDDVGDKIGFIDASTLSSTKFESANTKTAKLFPNPVKRGKDLNIELEGVIGKIQIFDLNGKQFYSDTIDKNTAQINTQLLNSGVYILRTENSITKFIVE